MSATHEAEAAVAETGVGNGLDWLDGWAVAREEAGLRRRVRPREADDGLLDLASNDYLGLGRHPEVVAAAAQAALTWGAGSTGSRLVTGSTRLHADLEEALAAHLGAERGLVFSSGYLANLGLITALAGPGDLIVSDALNHASIIDACRLSRARVVIVPHGDADAVDRVLAERGEKRALVVTESVFSVDGDQAPLAELAAITERRRAALVVDEAHGLGVIGDSGRGALHAAGLAGAAHVVATVTLSKSLGSQGGAIVGPERVIAHAIDTCRSFIFDTGLAPACAGAALAALGVLQAEPHRAADVRRRALELTVAARGCGLTATHPKGAVASVVIGEPEATVRAAELMLEQGVRVGCFRPPSVPDRHSRLRLTARADLTEADMARATAALRVVARNG